MRINRWNRLELWFLNLLTSISRCKVSKTRVDFNRIQTSSSLLVAMVLNTLIDTPSLLKHNNLSFNTLVNPRWTIYTLTCLLQRTLANPINLLLTILRSSPSLVSDRTNDCTLNLSNTFKSSNTNLWALWTRMTAIRDRISYWLSCKDKMTVFTTLCLNIRSFLNSLNRRCNYRTWRNWRSLLKYK